MYLPVAQFPLSCVVSSRTPVSSVPRVVYPIWLAHAPMVNAKLSHYQYPPPSILTGTQHPDTQMFGRSRFERLISSDLSGSSSFCCNGRGGIGYPAYVVHGVVEETGRVDSTEAAIAVCDGGGRWAPISSPEAPAPHPRTKTDTLPL